MSDVSEQKRRIRDRVWKALEAGGMARPPRPVRGRIPNFQGAEEAAELLTCLEVFRNADVINVAPDSPQRAVRLAVLKSGKTLVVPTPRLAGGFLVLEPYRISRRLRGYASTIRGSIQMGRKVDLKSLPEVDMIVTGSVAVDLLGNRLGKGEGYSEIEYAVLSEAAKVDEGTPIATTVHELQLADSIPSQLFDFSVDVIATPKRVISVPGARRRPSGVLWDLLDEAKISAIPLLRQLKAERRAATGANP